MSLVQRTTRHGQIYWYKKSHDGKLKRVKAPLETKTLEHKESKSALKNHSKKDSKEHSKEHSKERVKDQLDDESKHVKTIEPAKPKVRSSLDDIKMVTGPVRGSLWYSTKHNLQVLVLHDFHTMNPQYPRYKLPNRKHILRIDKFMVELAKYHSPHIIDYFFETELEDTAPENDYVDPNHYGDSDYASEDSFLALLEERFAKCLSKLKKCSLSNVRMHAADPRHSLNDVVEAGIATQHIIQNIENKSMISFHDNIKELVKAFRKPLRDQIVDEVFERVKSIESKAALELEKRKDWNKLSSKEQQIKLRSKTKELGQNEVKKLWKEKRLEMITKRLDFTTWIKRLNKQLTNVKSAEVKALIQEKLKFRNWDNIAQVSQEFAQLIIHFEDEITSNHNWKRTQFSATELTYILERLQRWMYMWSSMFDFYLLARLFRSYPNGKGVGGKSAAKRAVIYAGSWHSHNIEQYLKELEFTLMAESDAANLEGYWGGLENTLTSPPTELTRSDTVFQNFQHLDISQFPIGMFTDFEKQVKPKVRRFKINKKDNIIEEY